MATYKYSLDKFPHKACSPQRLLVEAAKAGVRAFPTQAEVVGSEVVCAYVRPLDQKEKAKLDAAIAAHVDDSHTLSVAISTAQAKVDAKTREIIGGGFLYQGKRISLSDNSQRNISVMEQAKDSLSYPVVYATADDLDQVVLSNPEEVHEFFLTAMAGVSIPLQAGVLLKQKIAQAKTVEEALGVKDTR